MLKNFVLETANAPGTSTTFNLGGAASGRLSYSGAGFTNGQLVFYVMDDGSQKEWGIATFNTGSPNTMTRTTVIGNSVGTTAKLNFSGTTNVYNSLPAEKTIYADSNGALQIGAPGNIMASNKQLFRGHLNGLITSRNSGTPTTKIDISVGAAMDEISQAGFITSSAVLTVDATTTGANGLDTGSLAIGTWYNVHAIGKTDGTVAGFMSTSLTPTLPSGYSLRRRIASVLTDGSAHFIDYSQNDDEFLWKTPVGDLAASATGTTSQLIALHVPLGVKTKALFNCTMSAGTAGINVLFTSPDATDVAAGGIAGDAQLSSAVTSHTFANSLSIRVNTSQQVRVVSSDVTAVDCVVSIATRGWIDTRGRLA